MGKEKTMLTDDRPTRKLHIGRYIGSLRRRVELQNSGLFDKTFIFIADIQTLTDSIDNPEKACQDATEVTLDYLACGFDPEKSTIFVRSRIPELRELTFYCAGPVAVSRLQRSPTVKTETQIRDFETSVLVGFFTCPVSQIADVTAFRAITVPVGEDQESMIEWTREIICCSSYIYGEILIELEILLSDSAACPRLLGTNRKVKMSKSLGNYIHLSEEAGEVQKKVMNMFTDPDHLRVQDPDKIEDYTIFIYLDALCRPEHFEHYLSDHPGLDELRVHYQRSGLGDVEVERFFNAIMQEKLEPIHNRRKGFEEGIPTIYEMLRKDCEVARATAAGTLSGARETAKIDCFDDAELINEQVKRLNK